MISVAMWGFGISLLINLYLVYRVNTIKKKMRKVSEITKELSTLSHSTYGGLKSLRQEQD
jgi:hypothetical protein